MSRLRPGIGPFVRASALHIGAAAATASLRDELIQDERATAHDVDAAYAVSRVTPGTNLLALYALLGHRLGGWPWRSRLSRWACWCRAPWR